MSLEIINTLKKMLKGIDTLRGVLYNHHARHQQDGTDDLESLLKLANLVEKSHASLTGVTASQHHSKTSKLSEITIDVIKDWQGKNITNLGAGAHDLNAKLNSIITKLSQLTIDADKNWNGKAITNPGNVDGVDISAHAANVNAHHTKFTITEHDTTTRHPLGTVVPHDALASLTEKAHSSLTGVTADQHHAKTAFGSWANRTFGTSYQAATDGFVVANCTAIDTDNERWTMIGYTDGSNPPTTERMCAKGGRRDGTGVHRAYGSFCMPVRKDDWYKCTFSVTVGSGTTSLYWIPLS